LTGRLIYGIILIVKQLTPQMKNFPTANTIHKAIERKVHTPSKGLTLTEIIKETHPSFDYIKYGKQGHRALILEALVKTGKVTAIPQGGNKGFLYVSNRLTKRERIQSLYNRFFN